jgi:molybdate-binding protein
VACSLHIRDAATGDWNVPLAREKFSNAPVVLVEFAWRERGLALAENAADISTIVDLRGKRFAPRQPEAGSQQIFEQLLAESGLTRDQVIFVDPSRTESDAALAVQTGKADATFGLGGIAQQHGLKFVPIIRERFDLIVDRRSWFEPPMQTLLAFCRTSSFAQKADELGGYDISGFSSVHFNGI